jgi:hypothetical protein
MQPGSVERINVAEKIDAKDAEGREGKSKTRFLAWT